jgi:hypothetical protein
MPRPRPWPPLLRRGRRVPPPEGYPPASPTARAAVPYAHPPLPLYESPRRRPGPNAAPQWSESAPQQEAQLAHEHGAQRPQPVAALAGPAPHADAAADASALAAAFGVDFLSWDESDPERRGRALVPYVAPPTREEQLVRAGWSGSGRQRAELALPGSVVRLNANRLLVHVRVRVTPFRRVGDRLMGARDTTDVLPFPAAAPAPSDPAWLGLDSYWYELLIPMFEIAERWRVDLSAVIVVPPLPALDGGGGVDNS